MISGATWIHLGTLSVDELHRKGYKMSKFMGRRCNKKIVSKRLQQESISKLSASFFLYSTCNEMWVVKAMTGWELDNGRRLCHVAMKRWDIWDIDSLIRICATELSVRLWIYSYDVTTPAKTPTTVPSHMLQFGLLMPVTLWVHSIYTLAPASIYSVAAKTTGQFQSRFPVCTSPSSMLTYHWGFQVCVSGSGRKL